MATKTPRKEPRSGLGIRATEEQRAWIVAAAKQKGLTVQGFFEEMVRRMAPSPFDAPNTTLREELNFLVPLHKIMDEIGTIDGPEGKFVRLLEATIRAARIAMRADETTISEKTTPVGNDERNNSGDNPQRNPAGPVEGEEPVHKQNGTGSGDKTGSAARNNLQRKRSKRAA